MHDLCVRSADICLKISVSVFFSAAERQDDWFILTTAAVTTTTSTTFLSVLCYSESVREEFQTCSASM